MIHEPRSYELELTILSKLPDEVKMSNDNNGWADFWKISSYYITTCRKQTKKLCNNTYLELDEWNNPQVRLHGTVIARFLPFGLRVSAGDWFSATTKSRLNFLVREYTSYDGICQRNFSWYYRTIVFDSNGNWQQSLTPFNNDEVIQYKPSPTRWSVKQLKSLPNYPWR